ncbi:MAG: hypothetical protein F6K41_43000 [Symploca sp. SIO3E6]|nr:hypothetical protein [Caldora sp. SIO3E6]
MRSPRPPSPQGEGGVREGGVREAGVPEVLSLGRGLGEGIWLPSSGK